MVLHLLALKFECVEDGSCTIIKQVQKVVVMVMNIPEESPRRGTRVVTLRIGKIFNFF
jgi:hypothetical protein